VSGSIGAVKAQEVAGQLEQSLKDYQPPADVQRQLTLLDQTLARLIADLEAALPQEAVGSP
jgi:HPt (histidine-containing phosphotransfer) domain-containing protein